MLSGRRMVEIDTSIARQMSDMIRAFRLSQIVGTYRSARNSRSTRQRPADRRRTGLAHWLSCRGDLSAHAGRKPP